MESSFLPYSRQLIDDEDIAAVVAVLRGQWLTTGPTIKKFEERFAETVEAKHAVACSSGTAGLHLAAAGLGIGPGDWVVVPSVTFLATANAVRYVGAEVVFADVDSETGLMGAVQLEEALLRIPKNKVKAVIPVHLNGQTVEMQPLRAVVEHAQFFEDACHALGGHEILSNNEQVKVGSCHSSQAAIFSTHAVKTIASGEGGVVTTNNETLANKLRELRNHGMVRQKTDKGSENFEPWYYEMHDLGFNYRLTDVQCALGLSQLSKLLKFVEKRANLRQRYSTLLSKCGPHVKPLSTSDRSVPAWHLSVVLIDFEALGIRRSDVMRQLSDRGIGTQVHYIPLHTQPYYLERYGMLTLPGAESYYSRCLSLPLWPGMSIDQVDSVILALAEALGLEIVTSAFNNKVS